MEKNQKQNKTDFTLAWTALYLALYLAWSLIYHFYLGKELSLVFLFFLENVLYLELFLKLHLSIYFNIYNE